MVVAFAWPLRPRGRTLVVLDLGILYCTVLSTDCRGGECENTVCKSSRLVPVVSIAERSPISTFLSPLAGARDLALPTSRTRKGQNLKGRSLDLGEHQNSSCLTHRKPAFSRNQWYVKYLKSKVDTSLWTKAEYSYHKRNRGRESPRRCQLYLQSTTLARSIPFRLDET
jgi:hypothetical protein